MKKRFFIISGLMVVLVGCSLAFNIYSKSQKKTSTSSEASNKTKEEKPKELSSLSTTKPLTTTETLSTDLKTNSSGSHNTVDDVNTLSNYLNGGYVRYSKPYLFISPYVLASDTPKLVYSMEDGTTMFKKLDFEGIYDMNIVDDSIIYRPFAQPDLYKEKIQAPHEEKKLLSQCGAYFIYNDWIYFISTADLSIKKMNLNGDSLTDIKTNLQLPPNSSLSFSPFIFVNNDKIYFSSISTSGSGNDEKWKNTLYSMNLDGSGFQSVLEDTFIQVNIYNNSIYYFKMPIIAKDGEIPKQELMRFDLNTKKTSTILQTDYSSQGSINIYKDELYFISNSSDLNVGGTQFTFRLQKYNLNTQKISTVSGPLQMPGKIFILNDRIFVLPEVNTDRNQYIYYSIKTDGSEEKYVK
ncbi:DUF5050 domain-containing protein [Clostridium manihotivorum]|nr:DUF5050 domain-containing protein [Clostridium manihotivorum]